MSFLKKSSSIVNLTIPTDAQTAQRILNSLTTLVAYLTPEELELLAKAVQQPVLKTQALAKLKEFV